MSTANENEGVGREEEEFSFGNVKFKRTVSHSRLAIREQDRCETGQKQMDEELSSIYESRQHKDGS